MRRLTPEAMAHLGTPNLAYVKPVVWEDRAAYSICAADGMRIAIVGSREAAITVARQHDLDPVSVH